MDFHIVKMYKDKEVNKNVKNIFINVWRKSVFDIYLTEFGTALTTILQWTTGKLWKPENCENRNDPDLVQAFLKKWWVESDFKAPNLPFSLRLKGYAILWGH
jgi:hypothetical protein